MIGHPSLREIISSDLLGAIARSNLALSQFRLRVMGFLLLQIIEFCTQQGICLCPVLDLGFLRLGIDHDSGRDMRQPDSGIRCVDTLPACAGRPADIDPDILFIDLYIHFLRFRHHRHRDRGRMDTPAGFRFRHPLYPVHSAFIFHNGIDALPAEHKGHALHAADTDLLHFHGFHPPAV